MNLEHRQSRGISPALLLAGLTVLALALRFGRLGDWNFQATEMFTLRDSVTAQWHNSRPLGYLLNYYLVRPFLPLDEFGLRLLPAIFGVLAIPAFYFVTRRLLGVRAALLGALLITVSHLHVMYSQLARYWSLVFLLSAIYPYALYIGVRERNRGALALGAVTGALAALAHPVSLLLLMGPSLLLLSYLRREHLSSLWRQSVRWAALFIVIIGVVIAWRFVPLLYGWVTMHDKNPASGQFLLPGVRQGLKQIVFIMALSESLTLPVVLISIAGLYHIWRERDRTLGLFLITLAAFPIAFITLISMRTPVSQYYVLPAIPVLFMGAGAFLDRVFDVEWSLRPRWLLPATLVLVVISVGLPTLASEYLNGRRYDFRGMARWLGAQIQPGDLVFSDQPMVLAHYLPGTKVEHLRPNTTRLEQSLRALGQEQGGVLWIVAPAQGHTFRTDLKRGGLIDWIHENCQLRNITGRGRVDFRQQYLQIYRCPPAPVPTTAGEQRPATSSQGRG